MRRRSLRWRAAEGGSTAAKSSIRRHLAGNRYCIDLSYDHREMRIARHRHQGQPDVSDRHHRHRRPTQGPQDRPRSLSWRVELHHQPSRPSLTLERNPATWVTQVSTCGCHTRSPKDGFCYNPPPAARRAAPSSPAGSPPAWNAQGDRHATGTRSPGNWPHRAGRPGLVRCGSCSRAAIARCRTASCR